MEWNFLFFFNSGLLGVGLAMDAFSVSMANGLHDPKMSVRRMCIIAGTFGVFQAVMPVTGWVCVHTIVELFSSFEEATDNANNAKGWTPSIVFEEYNGKQIKKLIGYIGGTGVEPTANVGQYYTENGFTRRNERVVVIIH